jgi:UDP-N-acetylglucosamine 2-epimerase (non-hydrolysing)
MDTSCGVSPHRVVIVVGTRPEAIKMAPVILAMKRDPRFEAVIVATGQHNEMLHQVLPVFHITPDYNLEIMRVGQTLEHITTRVLEGLSPILERESPEIVLVHGDTSTAFASALCAFYHQLPVGHVEAGLRTWDKSMPYPEEMNRQLIDDIADVYFAPTPLSRENLLKENHPDESIVVTGNTAIDAMRLTVKKDYHSDLLQPHMRNILLTMHRRENVGQPMVDTFNAVNRIVEEFPDVNLIYPLHPNPAVREIARKVLLVSSRIRLIEPVDVVEMHNLMAHSYLILTDSGGVQEEAPSLGVPVLVLRDKTERPEGIEAGVLKLIGTSQRAVYENVKTLLTDREAYRAMSHSANPYGDGHASERILDGICRNGAGITRKSPRRL